MKINRKTALVTTFRKPDGAYLDILEELRTLQLFPYINLIPPYLFFPKSINPFLAEVGL